MLEVMRSARRQRSGRLRTGVLLVLVLGLGCLLGGSTVIGVAIVSSTPAVFLTAGVLVAAAVTLAGSAWATRRMAPVPRRRAVAACTAGLTVLFTTAALVPLNGAASAPPRTAGERFVTLSTGSRIAYTRIPARGTARPDPVVIVHGGPGTPDMRGDSAYFGRLADDGFAVYVYDQFGSGASARAKDPDEYTTARAVADLEALRKHIGAEKMLLLGHSYGGRIAATYLARHPDRVSRIVLSSPADLAPESGGASLLGLLDTRQKLGVFAAMARPRIQLAYSLLQVNPTAAHALVGDGEVDGDFEAVYDRSRPALHCPGQDPGPALRGVGFYANQYPQSPTRDRPADPRPALARTVTPALVIKGSCDYLSWSSAVGYLRTLPHSELFYLPGAGHNAYQDQPERYLAEVRAFLTGARLPTAAYRGTRIPAGYRGPH